MQRMPLFGMLFLFLSCKGTKDISVKHPISRGQSVTITIPKGYYFLNITGGENNDIYEYSYCDSSIIYISKGGGLNGDNIRNANLQDKLLIAELDKDSLFVEGVDKNGLYWEHKFYVSFSVGYLNASKEKKQIFDKAIQELKVK